MMTILRCLLFCFAITAYHAIDAPQVQAITLIVDSLGDEAWDSGDTRADGYTDVNGGNQLVPGRTRTDIPALLEDTLISERISFVVAPQTPPMGSGATRLRTAENADKATLDLREWDSPFDDPIEIEYAWYRVAGSSATTAAPALKILIDTSEMNPSGPQAEDRYETVGDKILVYEPYLQGGSITDQVWTTETIDPDSGFFWLVNLTGNSALPATNPGDLLTLAEWQTVFASAGESGSLISSLQIGIGSGNPSLETYVDYLSFSDGVETTVWDYEAVSVPEPSSIQMLLVVFGILAVRQRRVMRF